MNKYNHFQVRYGSYDWLHPDETQTQYIFYLRDDAPFDKKSFGVVVTNLAEDAFDTVYECAVALLDAVNEYVYHPDRGRVEQLVKYLGPYLYKDKLYSLFADRRLMLEEVERIDKRIASVEREMEFDKVNQ